ncbi:SPOR domain-containing protein [Bacteroidales bacterium OttesenSCG-928-M11]|nr:SPOR domain-containing protein [Bacteroidales bacterium OttesenSCG-928-M11]
MQNINFHLAYLLTKHECIIVQGLGAFIVIPNNEKQKEAEGLWLTPENSLGFNPNITHVDGLLANSLSKEKGISYKEACWLVKQYGEDVKSKLISGQTINIPWIGSLKLLSDGKIEFIPAAKLSCNSSFYGFANFHLSPLSELTQEVIFESPTEVIEINSRKSYNKKRFATIAAAVASLFILSIPANDYSGSNHQSASILNFRSLPSTSIEMEKEQTIAPDTLVLTQEKIIETNINPAPNTRYYYIIVASLPTKELAEKKVFEYRENDFPQAAIVSKEDKHRIYVNKFEDKNEAESFLNSFRTSFPKHAKAWLLAQRG